MKSFIVDLVFEIVLLVLAFTSIWLHKQTSEMFYIFLAGLFVGYSLWGFGYLLNVKDM